MGPKPFHDGVASGPKPRAPAEPKPNPNELVCQELVELVTDYLSATLATADRVRFEQHLLTCPPCMAYLAQVEATRALSAELGAAPPAPSDGDVEQQLAGMFRRWHGKQGGA
jgi:anti-sigma factor RsiW